jgi:hypothetical protein
LPSIRAGHNIWRLSNRRLPFFLIFAISVTGIYATSQGTDTSARIGENFELRIGKTVTIAGEPLSVSFDRVVEDSRCPTNTTCVWAGTAVVQLGVRVSDTVRGSLNLQTLPDDAREAVFQKYRLRLIQLAPAPTDSAAIPPEQYVLTLMVRRLE